MPYPFSKGVFICGAPIIVNRESTEKELEQKRLALQESLLNITERADSYFKNQLKTQKSNVKTTTQKSKL